MKAKILSLLRERKDYVSGQEMCGIFGVSRTAVWKAVRQLQKEGYPISAVSNRGYRIGEEQEEARAERYGANELASRLQTQWAGRELIFLEETDSTNTQAKLAAERGGIHGLLVAADAQKAGRGRRGRDWESPSGKNIYFTLLLRPAFSPDKASMLTLVMAYAVAEAVRSLAGGEGRPGIEEGESDRSIRESEEVYIKWPNDIVAGDKKVCGILTEMSAEQDYIHYVVIGVGVNVHSQVFDRDRAAFGTSLEQALHRKIDRSLLLAHILKCFEKHYAEFLKTEDLSRIQEKYNKILVNAGREVLVLDSSGEYRGVARGITAAGELMVEREDGRTETVYAGEVSVRGIYGYV